jgi:hypothetical protein
MNADTRIAVVTGGMGELGRKRPSSAARMCRSAARST